MMRKYRTHLNKPALNYSAALTAMKQALDGALAGGGPYTELCQNWLTRETSVAQSFLTSSGTDALEMAAHLANLKPGDEVIMPSYTFSSTANAVVLRGAVPVFIDIRSDTLNIDEALIELAITKRTRAICPVHYAGVGCAMDKIMSVAKRHKLLVIEDAAQGIEASFRGKPLGSFGDFGAFSFHASKNITSGEGGALLIRNKHDTERAEILWEKGTNRSQLIRGEIDKYTWVDIGSSFLMSELNAALLWTQLKAARQLTQKRLRLWQTYHQALAPLEAQRLLRRPIIPKECQHNGHIYYILLRNIRQREELRQHLRRQGVEACFHYVPLHSSPAGKHYARTVTRMPITNRIASTLLRLPLYPDLTVTEQKRIIGLVSDFMSRRS